MNLCFKLLFYYNRAKVIAGKTVFAIGISNKMEIHRTYSQTIWNIF